MLPDDFVPQKPFADFKWKWASVAPTESLNDPLVLLGVLFRLEKLESLNVKYSSPEFALEMQDLTEGINKYTNLSVNLATRTGDRNLFRNSGQYWESLGLVDKQKSGIIALTDFGRMVAERKISQTEFAAITIQTLTLPNPRIQSKEECDNWKSAGLEIFPLRLILKIIHELGKNEKSQGYLNNEELTKVVIPLSGCNAEIEDYVKFILKYRQNPSSFSEWPDCIERANDKRISREFLLFLKYYGYLNMEGGDNFTQRFQYNFELDAEIKEIIKDSALNLPLIETWNRLKQSKVTDEFERKRVKKSMNRPHQAQFRKAVLSSYDRCIITNVTMPEILEAAHIIPYAYNGEDTAANGLPMRTDIHILFDTGNLRIAPNGNVELTQRARNDYGATIPPRIVIPEYVNLDFVKWRWENYNGL